MIIKIKELNIKLLEIVLFDISSDDLLVCDLINIMVGDILPAYLLLVDLMELKWMKVL